MSDFSRDLNSADKGSMVYTLLVCLVAALGGLLFGYDTAVISGAIGPMQAYFGLTAAQTGWAASSALVGCVLGAMLAGTFSDRIGRKKVLIISAVLFLISAIGSAIPIELTELLLSGYPLFGEHYRLGLSQASAYPLFVDYRILGGLAVGAASMTSPMYIAEISPARIRGRLVSVNQFTIVTGMLVVYFVNYFIARSGDDLWNRTEGWRWMFASEALPAAALLLLMFTVPETPRFLAATGKRDQALAVLTRVNGRVEAERELQEIESVVAQETGSIRMLFQGRLKVVLVIGVALAILQQVTGINVFLYYAPEIFKKLGTGTDVAMLQTVVVGAVNLLFTIVAIWTVDRLGRKPLMIAGAAGMGICLAAMGASAVLQSTQLWVLGFILGYIACFALAVGPVTWVILSEIFPTRIRGRAMAIATTCLWIANFFVSLTFPIMDGNDFLVRTFHHGFPFFVYAAFCVGTILLVWRYIPETKGRSLEQIEEHWLRG